MKLGWASLSAADFLSVARKYSDDAAALRDYSRGAGQQREVRQRRPG